MRNAVIGLWLLAAAGSAAAQSASSEIAALNLGYQDRYSYSGYYNEQWTGHSNFFVGMKNLNHSDWGDVDQQVELAILTDFRKVEWPISIAVDVRFSFASTSESLAGFDVSASGNTFELNLGVRKVLDKTDIRPFIGAGFSLMRAAASVEVSGLGGANESAMAFGYWADGGVLFIVSKGFTMGLEVSFSSAAADFNGTKIDAGGFQVGLSLGGTF